MCKTPEYGAKSKVKSCKKFTVIVNGKFFILLQDHDAHYMKRRIRSLCKKMRFRDNRVYSLPCFETVPSMVYGGCLSIHLHEIRV